MRQTKTAQDKFNVLYRQVETWMLANDFNQKTADFKDPLKLIQELKTFQIQLESQIEKRYRSQQELMRSQINYIGLYDSVPVGSCSISSKGLIINVNMALAEMLSEKRGHLVNQSLSDYISIDDHCIYYHHLKELSELKTKQICELHMQKTDGNQLDVQLESRVVLNKFKKPYQFLVIITDISKYNQAKKQLEEQIRLRTILIEALPYPTMLISKNRTIIFANKVARDSGAQVGGLCWRDFGHCDHIPTKDKLYMNQNTDETCMVTKCTFCLADVALKDLKPAIAPEVKAFGRILEIHWVPVNKIDFLHYALDITDRKRAETRVLNAKINLEKKVKKRTFELEDMNTTLKTLLKKREEDKLELGEKIFANYKLIILPNIQKLKTKLIQKDLIDLMDVLETNLNNILSPFSKTLSDPMVNLSPSEIQVADLIKFGKSNKEISEILNNSVHTIATHRENIRKKLKIKHKKINLRSFLRTLH
ncbi:MAG: LuxR C-terminal-related transcriptional regulator [Proteobacteria bacterium]|nr:LuxR C-terminal-related transcriptional regulator [Pseudomonadota bacterium]MBU1581527.1 LuxR C-terminal-related transcriptional regulator [Pseudomonadota bacterium]MBU2456251.1 LuxR C-terminal-related transcriptional regulator [Pseudomonadota bacterium]MBU2627303.1 LuxR C-terminal-related transcriptional regulator [Pseudomonadota bacterium]